MIKGLSLPTRVAVVPSVGVVVALTIAPIATLETVRIAAAIFFCFACAAAAGFHVPRLLAASGTRVTDLARIGILAALAILLLVRGAPHNNPLVFAVFEAAGALGPVLFAGIIIGAGVCLGIWLGRNGLPETFAKIADDRYLPAAIAGLGLLAGLAALSQVLQNWDVPGWGDAIFWDRIAHLIARGDLQQGHSYYMPVYQYGSAFLYKVFGHFFWVQQLSNVAMAPLTVIFLCLAAREAMFSNWSVLLVGALATTHDYLRITAQMMQIENWYIPVLCFALWIALRTWRRAGVGHAVLLGLACALVFGLRTQGSIFAGLLLLTPLLGAAVPWRKRVLTVLVASLCFAALGTPWTVRNLAVDGRLSPVGTQGPAHIAMSNDPRTFYGIRRDLGASEIAAEWEARYPDPDEREQAMGAYVRERLLGDPSFVAAGAFWRSLAFYGLLPDGVWAEGGPQATDWRATGKDWLMRNLATLSILVAAAAGLALRRDRLALFLLSTVGANMFVVLMVGFTEPRLHFPVLPILFLAAAGGLQRRPETRPVVQSRPVPYRVVGGTALAVVAVLAVAFSVSGRYNLFRPIMEPAIAIAGEQPSADGASLDAVDAEALDNVRPGEAISLTVALTNHHLPVKWYDDEVAGFPAFAVDPAAPIYFRAVLVDSDRAYRWGVSRMVAIRLAGARSTEPLFEDDIVEIAGTVRYVSENGLAFIDAQTASKLGRSTPLTGQPLTKVPRT